MEGFRSGNLKRQICLYWLSRWKISSDIMRFPSQEALGKSLETLWSFLRLFWSEIDWIIETNSWCFPYTASIGKILRNAFTLFLVLLWDLSFPVINHHHRDLHITSRTMNWFIFVSICFNSADEQREFVKRLSIHFFHLFVLSMSVYLRPVHNEPLVKPVEDMIWDDYARICFEIATIISCLAFLLIQQSIEIRNSGFYSFFHALVSCVAIFITTKELY